MYATAAARSDGLLLLCGGRDAEGIPLGDAYGLARHRDGRWEWAAAPGVKSLLHSSQHTFLHVWCTSPRSDWSCTYIGILSIPCRENA